MEKTIKKRRLLFAIASVFVIVIAACIVYFVWKHTGEIQENKKREAIEQKLNDSFMEKVDSLADLIHANDGETVFLPEEISSTFKDCGKEIKYFIDDLDSNGTKEIYLGYEADYGFVILNIYSGINEGELYMIYSGSGIVLLNDLKFITSAEMHIQYMKTINPNYEDGLGDYGKNRVQQAWILEDYCLMETDFPDSFNVKEVVLSAIE